MRCDPDADAALRRAPSADRRQPTYQALAVRLQRSDGQGGRVPRRLHGVMSGDSLLSELTLLALNPLDDNRMGGSSADQGGYRRFPIYWPDSVRGLSSPRSGFARWITDPAGTVREAGLADILGGCL